MFFSSPKPRNTFLCVTVLVNMNIWEDDSCECLNLDGRACVPTRLQRERATACTAALGTVPEASKTKCREGPRRCGRGSNLLLLPTASGWLVGIRKKREPIPHSICSRSGRPRLDHRAFFGFHGFHKQRASKHPARFVVWLTERAVSKLSNPGLPWTSYVLLISCVRPGRGIFPEAVAEAVAIVNIIALSSARCELSCGGQDTLRASPYGTYSR